MRDAGRPLPIPTPETAHFWEGTKRGRLLLQHCGACAAPYFPPRPFCPRCGGAEVTIIEASGRARLHSYVISQRSAAGLAAPYAVALVELAEGPRMMSNIIEVPQTPEALRLDMVLEAVFEPVSDAITLPLFRPAGDAR